MKLAVIIGAIILIVAGLGVWAVMTDRPVDQDDAVSGMKLEDALEADGTERAVQVAPTTLPESETTTSVAPSETVVDETSETTVASTGATVTVSMNEAGFSPRTVTIAVGDTVNFVNDGQAKHWPASDLHPTHEILPDFDSKRGLETGEEYSHTFTKAGEWQCHDHLAPRNTCTIIVE